MILVIDNYDSFTWNLVAQLRGLGAEVLVVRNDEKISEEWDRNLPGGILISPGPGIPGESGICSSVIRKFSGRVPIFGICLGHQLIGELAGGRVVKAVAPVHGKTSMISHDGRGIFKGMPQPFEAMRYHSLVMEKPFRGMEVSAMSDTGEIMGIRDAFRKLDGVQFHPESILTQQGDLLIRNWLQTVG